MQTKHHKTAFAFLIIGCIILFFFKILPIAASISLSLKNYSIMHGFKNSENIGLRNFSELLSSPYFPRIIRNTLRLNLLTVIFALPFSAVFIYFSGKMKNRSLALILTGIFALSAVVPPIILASGIVFRLGIAINGSIDWVYALLAAARISGYLAVGAYFMNARTNAGAKNITFVALAVMVLAALSRFMTSDYEIISMLQNPMIYDRADVIDTYSFRTGLMQMQIGASSALWVMKFVFELLATAIAAVGVFAAFKLIGRKGPGAKQADSGSAAAICSLFAAASLILVSFSIFPKQSTPFDINALNISYNAIYFILAIVVSGVSAFACAWLAYPFSSKSSKIKLIYAIVLVLALYGTNNIQRLLLYKSLGLLDTIIAPVLNGIMPVWMIAAYALILNRPGAYEIGESGGYMKTLGPAMVIIAALNFTFMWGNIQAPLMYTMSAHKYTATLHLRSLIAIGQQSLAINLISALPSIAVWAGAITLVSAIQKNRTVPK